MFQNFEISKIQNLSFVVELVDDGCDRYFIFMTIRVILFGVIKPKTDYQTKAQ